MTEPGIRAGADGAVQTQVSVTTSEHLGGRCPHGRDVWLVGGERWHRSKKGPKDSRVELLEPCAAGAGA